MLRRAKITYAMALFLAPTARAQAPVPALQYTPSLNFYKSAMTNPDDFSSNEVNASMQVYPFRPFTGDIQRPWGQTLMRDWIDPRYREANVVGRPEFGGQMIPGARAAFMARFVENIVGLPKHYKQKFQVNLWGGVGSGTFTPAPHFFIFSADGRVYRTFDPLKLPANSPGGFDFATAAREDQENTGRFSVRGNQLIIQFGGPGAEVIQSAVSPAGGFTASGVAYLRQ